MPTRLTNIKNTTFAAIIITAIAIGISFDATAQRRKRKNKAPDPTEVLQANLQQHVQVLAHDSLQGRRTGTPGEAKAIRYISQYYQQLGIAPAGTDGYLQPFVIDEGRQFSTTSTLSIGEKKLEPGKHYFPLSFSAEGAIQTDANVSLHESDDAWWINLQPIVEKHKDNPHFLLNTHLMEVAKDATNGGATALIFFNSSGQEDDLRFDPKDKTEALTIPALYITKDAIAQLEIDEHSSPVLEGKIAFSNERRTGTNVVAQLDNGAPFTIVLGAHLDHLGYGEDANSRHAGDPAIHNGADDNASGTAAIMELARLLKEKNDTRFNYLFINFSGEELGLYGSKYFTDNPTIDLKKVAYMINLDMVGRLNDSTKALTIGGFGTSPLWGSLLKPGNDFTFKIDSAGSGPSDHTSFYRKEIPVLFFFTGLHTDYHKPTDDAEKINFTGMSQIVQYIQNLIAQSPADAQPAFAKTREQSLDTRGFKVSIGIMPDYTFSGTGVKADGVIDDRPAKKAGLQANDIILQLGEHLVTSVETYMQCLNRFEKGETTTITIKRGTEVMEFPITF